MFKVSLFYTDTWSESFRNVRVKKREDDNEIIAFATFMLLDAHQLTFGPLCTTFFFFFFLLR